MGYSLVGPTSQILHSNAKLNGSLVPEKFNGFYHIEACKDIIGICRFVSSNRAVGIVGGGARGGRAPAPQ